MTRCMLFEKAVLRKFWFEVVMYVVYILNRSLVVVVEAVILEEKWS